jgi:hypothetical protein
VNALENAGAASSSHEGPIYSTRSSPIAIPAFLPEERHDATVRDLGGSARSLFRIRIGPSRQVVAGCTSLEVSSIHVDGIANLAAVRAARTVRTRVTLELDRPTEHSRNRVGGFSSRNKRTS